MSSLSTQTEMSNRAYENALQNYYAGLAEGPGRDLDKEMRDQQANELLDAFTAPIGAHFIDSGLENVKDYVNSGIKKAVQRGTDLGKQAAKEAVRAAAQRAGISEEATEDLLNGKMDAIKTVGQALDYIKEKAGEAGSEAVARLRGAQGQITDAVKTAGDNAADAAAKARGGAQGALDEGSDLLDQITGRVVARDLPPTLGAPPTRPTAAQLADIGAVEPPRVLEPGDPGFDFTKAFVPDPANFVPDSAFEEQANPRGAFAALSAQLPDEDTGPSAFSILQQAERAAGSGRDLDVGRVLGQVKGTPKDLSVDEIRDLKKGQGLFSRLFGSRKPLTPKGNPPLYLQEPPELKATFNDAFTGKEIDLTPKTSLPDGWGTEDTEGADDFLTNASDAAQKLVDRPNMRNRLERFRVLDGLGEDGIAGRRNIQVKGERVENSIRNLDGIFAYQRDVEQQAKELGSDLGRFKPVIQPSPLQKLTAGIDDVAEQAAAKQAAGLAPAHTVLADVLKQATTGEPKTAAALPKITPEAIGEPIDTLPDVSDVVVRALRKETAPFTEAKNPTSELANIMDVPDDQREIDQLPPDAPPTPPKDTPVNPFEDPAVQDKIDNAGLKEGEGGDFFSGLTDEDLAGFFDEPEKVDVVNDPVNDNEEEPAAPEADKPDAPPVKADKPDIGKEIESGLEKELPEEEVGADFGPVGDLVDLGLAAGTILGAVFGQQHDKPPPPPNLSNPTAPVGI